MTVEEQAAASAAAGNAGATGTSEKGTLLTGAKSTTSSTKGATQEFPHAWMGGLTTEQKADADLIESLTKFEKGIPDIVKSYTELEKKQSQTLTVPNEGATDEQVAAYRKAIGVPEKSTDYELAEVALPEGTAVDDQMQTQYLDLALKQGLTPVQAKSIHEWYMKTIGPQLVEARRIVKTTMEEATAALKVRHANDPDAMTYMERGFEAIGDPELAKLFADTGFGNHPLIVDFCISVGKKLGDSKFVDGSRGATLESSPIGQRSHAEIADVVYPKAADA